MTLRQTDGRAWAHTGYDLDGICTRPPALRTECETSSASVDGEDGIDNVFGKNVFTLFEALLPGYEEAVHAMHDEGRNAVLVSVEEWNGLPDDPRVVVWAAATVGSTNAEAGSPPALEFDDVGRPRLAGTGEPAPLPRWDGNDWTYVRSDSLVSLSPPTPLLRVDNAYVAGGVVVARLPPRSEFLFFSTDMRPERAGRLVLSRVRLTDATITFRIEEGGSQISNGVLAGRWASVDIGSTAAEVGVCPGTMFSEILGGTLTDLADVRSVPPAAGEFLPCDAISLGVSFVGSRVRIAGTDPGPGYPNVCAELIGDGGVDAGRDSAVPLDGGPDAGATDPPDGG